MSHELGDGADFEVALSDYAFDSETASADLKWSVVSTHDAAHLEISFSEHDDAGPRVHFRVDTSECRMHAVTLQVEDSAGGVASMPFALNLLGGFGAEMLLNGKVDAEVAAGAVGSAVLPGWKVYTWAGTYVVGRTAGEASSGGGGYAVQIEGLARGKSGVYQHVDFVAGTYELSFSMAYRELVGNSWGLALEAVVISGDLTIVETLPTAEPNKNWTALTLQFTVPINGSGTVYLRMHGTGYAFFDDVTLKQLLCHPDVETTVSVDAAVAVRPLLFEFPFREADALLCGYCLLGNGAASDAAAIASNIPTFQPGHPVCVRCAEANVTNANDDSVAADPVHLLASFEEGDYNPFGAATYVSMDSVNAGGSSNPGSTAGRGVELHGTYYDAHDTTGLLSDWSKYSYLKVNVFNPKPAPVSFYVEIRDVHSTGYWSRVNWYTAAAPGHSTITVPLQIFVGEKTVTKERRRLYLQKITRLVFSIESPNVVVLDQVRLEPAAPYEHLFPQLIMLDFGLPSSPVQMGFVPVVGADWYRNRVGYGLEPGSVISHIKDRRHPTNMLRDWIGFQSGGVAIDLPDGMYSVAVYMEDPG